MWYLEKKPLGELATDAQVARIARAFNWLPSDVRRQDVRDLAMLDFDIQAEKGSESELKRRQAERQRQKEANG